MTDEPLVLGIETSCDETAAAVVAVGHRVLSNVVHSQIELHARWRGVVPEVASRSHTERVLPIVEKAIEALGQGFVSHPANTMLRDRLRLGWHSDAICSASRSPGSGRSSLRRRSACSHSAHGRGAHRAA